MAWHDMTWHDILFQLNSSLVPGAVFSCHLELALDSSKMGQLAVWFGVILFGLRLCDWLLLVGTYETQFYYTHKLNASFQGSSSTSMTCPWEPALTARRTMCSSGGTFSSSPPTAATSSATAYRSVQCSALGSTVQYWSVQYSAKSRWEVVGTLWQRSENLLCIQCWWSCHPYLSFMSAKAF